MEKVICPICNRTEGGEMQWHHLKPRTFKTRTKEVHDSDNFVHIHKICHSAIHAFFKEKELFNYYHTVDRLLENEQMQKFVKWVGKKHSDFYVSMKRSNRRK